MDELMDESSREAPFDTDVLVVGAGPTGLTIACELARRGVRLRVVERAEAPSLASRGKGLQPRTLEVLDDLGVATTVLTAGAVKLPVRLYDLDGGWVDREPVTTPATVATPYPEVLWIAEFDVEHALRDRLAQDAGQVEFGTTVDGLTEIRDGVAATVRGPDGPAVVRARWVVGADGGHSTVRQALGVPFEGITNPVSYYLGDVRTLDLDRGRQHLWASPDGMLALTPLPSTELWQFQCGVPESVVDPAPPSLETYQRIIDERAGAGRVRFTAASWLSLYRANVRLAARYRTDRVLLAGDAVHAHPPAGGQGMNTGIQDAYNLGWKLAAVIRGADPALLDSYEAERRPVAAAMVEDTAARSARVRSGVDGDAAAVSGAVHGITDDRTTGLSIAYPDSPLSRDGAGSRVPHVTGLRGPGFAGTTLDLLRGPHWTAVAFSDDTDFDLEALAHDEIRRYRIGDGAIADPDGALKAALGVGNDTVVLIRPDGYTAASIPWDRTATLPDVVKASLPGDQPVISEARAGA